jgi:ABC-type multidrug transport system ATPase subunit
MGHNGAGKSTFINYLINFYSTEKQHPFLKELSKHQTPLEIGSFGYSPEIAMFDTNLRSIDYLELVSKIRKVEIDVEEVLKSVSLNVSPKQRIGEFSKGMRQRLSLALAMVGNPKYLVLDEPTSGLDIFGERVVLKLLKERKDDFHYIISTHSTKLALELGDEVWLFKDGNIFHKFYPDSEEEILELL